MIAVWQHSVIVFLFRKVEWIISKMTKHRMIMTSSDQEKLLEDFYDQLDNDTFLGNSFEDEDNLLVVSIAPELSSDDDDDVID